MTSPSQEEPLVIDGFKVHAKSDCVPPCPFHAPSDHPLKDAPMHIREDKSYLVERICPHGIGHDDPDSVAYMHKIGELWAGTHGCDGCCTGDYPIKPVPNEPSDEPEHVHNWQLAEFVKGKPIYSGMAVGTSVFEYQTGKKPDVSKFVCECGERKEVVHE